MGGEGTGTKVVTPGPIILSTFNARVDELVKDGASDLSSGEVDNAVLAAVKRYSRHKPQTPVHEFQGDGGYDYSLPDDWVHGFSRNTQVEYPYDKQRPNAIPKEEWTLLLKLVNSTQTLVLRFLAIQPVAGEYVRITYTIPHVVNDF